MESNPSPCATLSTFTPSASPFADDDDALAVVVCVVVARRYADVLVCGAFKSPDTVEELARLSDPNIDIIFPRRESKRSPRL